jgi:protein EFR3
VALVRCFQLAFSLRRKSLSQESKFLHHCFPYQASFDPCLTFPIKHHISSSNAVNVDDLQPSRRRCLYTMASAMLIFSAKVADVPQIIPLVKAVPSEKMVG